MSTHISKQDLETLIRAPTSTAQQSLGNTPRFYWNFYINIAKLYTRTVDLALMAITGIL